MRSRNRYADLSPAEEKFEYSRYYEHDGALRAYANRAMLLALLCVPSTLIAIFMAAYVRLQPPTVIRVDSNGLSRVLNHQPPRGEALLVERGTGSEPTEFERGAFVRLFLERYLNFSPDSVNRNWSDGLNMMTSNLRRLTLSSIQKENLIGKIQEDQITSVYHLRSLEAQRDDPLSFTAFGVKEIHRVREHQEATDRLVGEFHVRLITETRSEGNPGGLLIAEYRERLIEGERRDALAHETTLSKPNPQ